MTTLVNLYVALPGSKQTCWGLIRCLWNKMVANNKQTAKVVRIILLFLSYSLFLNISYAKGTIELYGKDVRGMHLVIYLSI